MYEVGTTATARSWDYSRSRVGGSGLRYPDDEVPGFEAMLDDLYDRQDVLARALLGAFAEMFELPPGTFTTMFEAGDLGTIRLINYPGNEGAGAGTEAGTDAGIEAGEEEGRSAAAAAATADQEGRVAAANFGISAHTDFEAFTLMHQDAPGLQFIHRGTGEWVEAPVRAGEFVVTVGDILERFTNGVLKATPHRVLNTVHARHSIIRFNAVAPNTMVAPLPAFVSVESPAKYTPVTMERHMETTLANLALGLGSWDGDRNVSTSATYVYDDDDDDDDDDARMRR